MCESGRTDRDYARLERRLEREHRARLEAEAIAERLADRLTRKAMYDPLTELANRALVLERLQIVLNRAEQVQTLVGVLFIDLDDFKLINDTLGHHAGDQLLLETARRLSCEVRAPDMVARLGGDEFVVVCVDVPDIAALEHIAGRIGRALHQPYALAGRELSPRASIGARLAAGGEDPRQVLDDADQAMYGAKRTTKAAAPPVPPVDEAPTAATTAS